MLIYNAQNITINSLNIYLEYFLLYFVFADGWRTRVAVSAYSIVPIRNKSADKAYNICIERGQAWPSYIYRTICPQLVNFIRLSKQRLSEGMSS